MEYSTLEVVFIKPGEDNFNFKQIYKSAKAMDEVTKQTMIEGNLSKKEMVNSYELNFIERGCIKFNFNFFSNLIGKLIEKINKLFSIKINNKSINSRGNNNSNTVNNINIQNSSVNCNLTLNIDNVILINENNYPKILIVERPTSNNKVYDEIDLHYICKKFIDTYVIEKEHLSAEKFVENLELKQYEKSSLRMLVSNIVYYLNQHNIMHTCPLSSLNNISKWTKYCLEIQLIKSNIIKY